MRHAFVIALVLALASYACGDAGPSRSAGPAPSATPNTESDDGPPPDGGPAPSATPDTDSTALPPLGMVRPPDLTVSAGGRSVTAGVGTYCWSEDDQGICVDKIGVPTPRGALVATPGTIIARLAEGTPREVSAQASPIAANATPTIEGEDGVFWETLGDGKELPVEALGSELRLTTTSLAPGRYLVAISVFFERGGDSQYGVLLELGPEG